MVLLRQIRLADGILCRGQTLNGDGLTRLQRKLQGIGCSDYGYQCALINNRPPRINGLKVVAVLMITVFCMDQQAEPELPIEVGCGTIIHKLLCDGHGLGAADIVEGGYVDRCISFFDHITVIQRRTVHFDVDILGGFGGIVQPIIL